MVPLLAVYNVFAGIRPLARGFSRYQVRPNPGELDALSVVARTPAGPLRVAIEGKRGDRVVEIAAPPQQTGELVVDSRETVELPRAGAPGRYVLPAGRKVKLRLRHG